MNNYEYHEVERLVEDNREKIGTKDKIAIYPYGKWGKYAERVIKDNYGLTTVNIDNYVKDCRTLKSVDNPNDFKWVVACKDYELRQEIVDSLYKIGVDKCNVISLVSERERVVVEKCPICESKDVVKIYGNSIYRCNDCSHAYRKYISDIVLDKYYDKAYWEEDKNRQGIMDVKPSNQWDEWLAGRLDILEHFKILEFENPSQIKILEFGCSEGMLLYELKKRGFDVKGNDVCAIEEISRKELGIEISPLPIEEFAKTGEKFDVIMSYHCVEHLRNPLEVTKNLGECLKKGGVLLMHVPVDDAEFGNMDHYHFFTKESGIKLLETVAQDVRTYITTYGDNVTTYYAGTFVGIKAD